MIFDSLSDIVKHTHGLGFIDAVKLRYDEEENKTHVESIVDSSVVLYGVLDDPIDGLTSTIGLSRMSVLNGYLNFAPFNTNDAQIKIMSQDRNGEHVPASVQFNSGKGHTASYRFMGAQQIENEIQVPNFTGANWDVVFQPTRQSVKDLSALRSIIGSLESDFFIETDNGDLNFIIGSDTSDSTKVTFASNVSGELRHSYRWAINTMLPILKLGDDAAEITVSISDAGVAKIDIDSGLAVYTYIIMKKAA